MYKLGMIDIETMQAVFNNRDFSGGVFNPVCVDDTIYYLGAFVSRDGLLRFPEKTSSLSGKQSDIRLVKLDIESYEAAAVLPSYSGPSKPYIALPYMNPLKFWLPMILVRMNEIDEESLYSDPLAGFKLLRLDGGGVVTVMSDPTDNNFISAWVYADFYYKMALVEMFTWRNTSFGIPLTFDFLDTVRDLEDGRTYRSTSASLTGLIQWGSGNWDNGFIVGAGYSRAAVFEDGKGAYEWKESWNAFFVQTGLVFTSRLASLQINAASTTDSFSPHVEGLFKAATDTRFPLYLSLFGSYDERGMDLHGVSRTFVSTLLENYVLNEYSNPAGLQLNWLAGGEVGIGLFSANIQGHTSHLYFNRFFGTLSVRNQIYDSKGHPDAEGIELNEDLRLIQSLGLKLGVKISFLPVVKTPMWIEPFALGTWKFSNTITGRKSFWNVYIGLTTSF
jgi:hypothetical protein